MNIILLSGGSGKRLWPLSNEVRSKQFLKLFEAENGQYESMTQRVCRQIRTVEPEANITITTGVQQKSAIINQLGQDIDICIEPMRRDTFPAIALAIVYLKEKRNLSRESAVIVGPVDPYTDNQYFCKFHDLEEAVITGDNNLVLMGISPTYPSEKYGYILPELGAGKVRKVRSFKEKPCLEDAKTLISQGAMWNSGVFAFKIGYILDILSEYVDDIAYDYLYEHYHELPKLSFDYAVVEKEKNIGCISFQGEWKDVGTWNTLAEEMSSSALGNVLLVENCENVNVINELDIPVLVAGIKDTIIAASADGIIISDKNASSFIKPYVDKIDQRVMFEEKSWGDFRVLSVEKYAMTVKLHINAGRFMSYHCHHNRDEVWTILKGEGVVVLGERKRPIGAGAVVEMPAGVKHTIKAITDMDVLEIQMGDKISDEDAETFTI